MSVYELVKSEVLLTALELVVILLPLKHAALPSGVDPEMTRVWSDVGERA